MASVMKKKRYWVSILLVLLLAVFTFLPFILSSSSVTRMIVSGLNKKTPGTLRIGSWLVGWQQGFLCQDIVYENRRKGLRISIPRLTSTQGLAELLLSPGNLGLLALDTPVVEFSAPGTPRDVPPDSQPAPAADKGKKNAWEKFAVQLQVRDGSLRFASGDGLPETGVKNIDLHSNLSAGEIDFDLSFRDLANQGEVAAKGHLNLPAGGKNVLETLYAETEVRVRDLQIRDYLSFAAHRLGLPVGEGMLTADFHIKIAGLEDFELNGSAEAADLKLAGGMLGKDSPSFRNVRLTLEEGEWSRLYRRVKLIRVESDAGSLDFSGEHKDRRIRINSRGSISIPVLFDQFPHMLKVREEAFIESGTLEFAADMDVEEQKGKFDFMARTENVGGLYNGRPFAWDSPVTAILHGENEGLDVRIRRLQVESPFLKAFGRGDLTSFALEASADVEKTLAELGRLFQHSWTGSGKLELLMNASAAGRDSLYTVDADLNIGHFSLSRQDTVVVPNQDFSIVGSAGVPFSLLREREGRFDLQFALSSWLGEIIFTMNGDKRREGLRNARYSTDTNLQLDSLVRLLHALDLAPEQADVRGDLQVQAAGYIDGSLVGFDEFNGRIHDFAYRNNDTGFSDPEIRLYIKRAVNDEIPSLVIHDLEVADSRDAYFRAGSGTNGIDIAAFSLFLHGIGMEAGPGNMQLEELVLENWRKPLDTVRAKGMINADLSVLAPLLQHAYPPAGDIRLAGAGSLTFSAADRGESGRDMTADLQIEAFSASRGGTLILPADDLGLSLYLEGRSLPGTLAVKDLRLFSGPLDLTAGGTVRLADAQREVALQGTLTPKMDKLAGILGSAFAADMTLQGRRSGDFVLRYRWPAAGETQGGRSLTLSAGLQADRIEYRGLRFSDLGIPVSLENEMLHLQALGAMNGGRVDFSAQTDFSGDPATVTVPENSRIMTDIELEKPLVEGILQGIHPLFGVLAVPTGRMNVTLDSFAWPVRPWNAEAAAFTAVFEVSRINLDSSGLLRSILAGFALEEERLQLRDSQISCSAGQGRISCTPVRITAADSEMVLSGSVGMDKSLDYVLEVPITEKLVSREVYTLLEGATVKVPITGSVGKPVFDQKMMTAAIRDLVKKAAVRVVEQQAEKLLPNLMQGARRQPQKK